MRALTARRRVLLLGGLAVIAHGFSRPTKDADVWLEPMASAEEWAGILAEVAAQFPEARLARLPHWTPIAKRAEIAAAADEIGMVRVLGFECPLDVFREPNEIEVEDFEPMWARSTPKEDGVQLPDPIDLLVSKEKTGRDRDLQDQLFLEGKIRRILAPKLEAASLEEARAHLARYHDHVVCEAALKNPDPAVRALAREILTELAAKEDWFSRDILARLAREGQ